MYDWQEKEGVAKILATLRELADTSTVAQFSSVKSTGRVRMYDEVK